MSELSALVLISVVLLILLAIGVRVAFALMATALLATWALLPDAQFRAFGPILWQSLNNPILAAVPLFIFMGDLFALGGLSRPTYAGLAPLTSRIPGGLLHSNIVACSVFAAASGSSVGTAAAMGSIAAPELNSRNYPRRFTYGSLAAGGTLGILIPPSLGMIIYGVLTGTSIGALFIAGLIPGLLLAGLFSVYMAIAAIRKPALFPREEWPGLVPALKGLLGVMPLIIVVVMVLGSLYFGIATPSESAAVGVLGMAGLPFLYRSAKARVIVEALKRTAVTTAMVLTIIAAAGLMSHVVAYLGIPHIVGESLASLAGTQLATLAVLAVMFLVLGMFLDPISIMALTLPVVFPAIELLGIDGVWFGVFLTVTVELGLITPPVGLNLFIIKGVDPTASWSDIIRGSLPFVVLMLIFLGVLVAFPAIATWLPSAMRG